MYNNWSLEKLYKGIDDPKLDADMARLENCLDQYKKAVSSLDPENAAASIKSVILLSEEMGLLLRRLAGFFSLRRSANATDTAGAVYLTKIQTLMASSAKEGVVFDKFVGSIEDLDKLIEGDEVLSQYKFHLGKIKESVSHKMSDEAEEVFAKMSISGGKAWGDLFSFLTAGVEVDYNGEKTTLSAIRGLAEDEDKEVRKAAYEAELACYAKIRDSIAFALNSIKAQVNTEAQLRGYGVHGVHHIVVFPEGKCLRVFRHVRMRRDAADEF